MWKLLLLFITVPLLELLILVQMGRLLGLVPTLALVFLTGALGAYLARNQGLGILARIRGEVSQGQMPAESLVDGLLVLVAGAVLLTPGLLTDCLGFLCLIPTTRRIIRTVLWKRLQTIASSQHRIVVGRPGRRDMGEVIDIEPL